MTMLYSDFNPDFDPRYMPFGAPPVAPVDPAQAAAPAPQPPMSLAARFGNAAKGFLGNRDLALALLANSGGPVRQSFGQILGQSGLQAQAMGQQRQDDALKRQYMMAQMAAMGQRGQQKPIAVIGPDGKTPIFVSENDAIGRQPVPSRENNIPSNWQEWQLFSSLAPADQAKYLQMKRAEQFKMGEVAGVPTITTVGAGAAPNTPSVNATPLTTLKNQAAGVSTIKQAENAAGALGTAQGEIAGGIQKKGSSAQTILGMLDEADKLLPDATGSLLGTGRDIVAGGVGISTSGAKNSARLKVIQGALVANMPRMEGPQSDADRKLYIESAGQIADSTVPSETRRAALQTVRALQNKYAERAQQPFQLFPNGTQDSEGWTVLPGGIRVREKK